MAITLISNVGFTEIDTSGTVNTVAGIKDNLPVQFYKIVSNINGQLVIDNNDNHKKLILDMNGKTINGQNQTAITYNGDDTLEIKGQGLITSGGTVRVSANGSGSYNATPTLGDGTVVITMTSPDFDITFNENYTQIFNDNLGNASTPVRTPDNIPSGETWTGLTGTNGANINGLTANGFTFNNTGTLATGATGAIGSYSFYRMTNAHRTRSDMGWLAYFWTSQGMFKKRVANNTTVSATNSPDYITEPAINPYTGNPFSPTGGKDYGYDHNAYSNFSASGRVESVSVPSRTFAITNNNTFDISFYSITPPETFVVTVVTNL